ncbi:putative callose synthase 8 [Sesamum angolense]|uniref:Callose synthase 8 n=1 Tax=Sesamum angolense TaxID=2727404 RepID=A0AAE1T8S0_9LAMI|nr:putative callose synthase 8 [Sesamum angolense]
MTEIVVAEPFDSEKLPVTLVSEKWKTSDLLGRFYAFEVAHNFDRASSGQGVRQFKTSLLQRLEQDDEVTLRKRRGKSDLHELRRVYWQYKDYIIKHGGYTLETREKLIKARAVASVLFVILNAVTPTTDFQALAETDPSRSEFYEPYSRSRRCSSFNNATS